MQRWKVLIGPIRHDGREYVEGNTLEADAKRIPQLIAKGRVKRIGTRKKAPGKDDA